MRLQASLGALLCVVAAYAVTPYELELEETLPEKSGISKIDYKADGDYWVMTVSENNFGDTRPQRQGRRVLPLHRQQGRT